MTLQLLHHEYLEQHPLGYQYTRFCDFYREWLARRRPSMRQVHKAGEKMFVDFAGMQPTLVDPKTDSRAHRWPVPVPQRRRQSTATCP